MTAAGRRRPSRQSIRGRVFVALLLMIAAASLLDRYLVVRQVQVDGLIARSADAVLALSGVRAGDSLFRLNEHAIELGVESDPYLRLLSIERRYPHTLILRVAESQPRATVGSAGAVALLDGDCRVLEVLGAPPAQPLPMVTGVRVTVRRPGARLETDMPAQVAVLSALLSELAAQNLGGQASELNVEDLDNLYFVTKAGMKVLLGDGDRMADKLNWFVAVSRQLEDEGVVSGTLDVSSGKNAVYSNR